MECGLRLNSGTGRLCGALAHVPVNLIWSHCFGHTDLLCDMIGNEWLCDECLYEILVDSQWSVGWAKRSEFLFGGHKDKMVRGLIYDTGIQALSSMCVECDNVIEVEYDRKFQVFPKFVEDANRSYFDKYIPKAPHPVKNQLCGKCLAGVERDYIKNLDDSKLPLLLDQEWLTSEARLFFEKRLMG